MTITLRPYQEEFRDGLRDAMRRHRRVLGVLPTGGGKTVVFADIAQRLAGRGKTAWAIAHRENICQQIGSAFRVAGIEPGFLTRSSPRTTRPIMVGMVQSLARRVGSIPAPDLLIVDEAHHVAAVSYQGILDTWPESYCVGFTATPQRTDGRGLGDRFFDMVLGPTTGQLIAGGFLAPFRYFVPPALADLSRVRTRAGDYARDDLADAMMESRVTGDAVEHYRQHLTGKTALAFGVTVEHAQSIASEFRAAGYRAEHVDGSMPIDQVNNLLAAIGSGCIDVLAACDLVSEGTDIPSVSGVINLRPTKSVIVHLQQAGRALRLKPDGGPAVILDHVGNALIHGLPDADRAWSLEGSTKAARQALPVRTCKQCFACFAPAPVCPNCGFEFPRTGSARVEPRREDGTLAEVTALPERRAGEAEHVWLARSGKRKEALRSARTVDQLRDVARALGYDPRWADHYWRTRRGSRWGDAA